MKNRADLVAFVTKCVEDGAAEIKAKGDKGLMEAVDDGGPHLDRLYDLAYGLIEHSGRALRPVGGLLPDQRIGAAGITAEEIRK